MVLYWHWWFHEEPLTYMDTFHWTKGSLWWKKALIFLFFLLLTERFFGEPKMVLQLHHCKKKRRPFKSVPSEFADIYCMNVFCMTIFHDFFALINPGGVIRSESCKIYSILLSDGHFLIYYLNWANRVIFKQWYRKECLEHLSNHLFFC